MDRFILHDNITYYHELLLFLNTGDIYGKINKYILLISWANQRATSDKAVHTGIQIELLSLDLRQKSQHLARSSILYEYQESIKCDSALSIYHRTTLHFVDESC